MKTKKKIISLATVGVLGTTIAVASVAQACAEATVTSGAETVRNSFLALFNYSANTATSNTTQFYDFLIQEINSQFGVNISFLNNITFESPDTNLIVSPDGTRITILQGGISFQALGNGQQSNFGNETQNITISNIVIIQGEISTIGAQLSGLEQFNQGLIVSAFRSLNGATATTLPSSTTNAGILAGALLNAIRLTNSTVSGIVSITIEDPNQTVTANQSGTILTVAAEALTVTVEGGNITSFTNSSSELTISRLAYSGGVLTNTSAIIVVGFIAEANSSELLLNSFLALNNTTSPPEATLIDQVAIYEVILRTIEDLNQIGLSFTISGITILNPNSVTVVNGVINIPVASLIITTNNALVNIYSNIEGTAVLSGLVIQNNRIIGNGGTFGNTIQPTFNETAFNALNNLNGATTTPGTASVDELNQRSLYFLIENTLRNINSAITQISRITINNPSTSIVSSLNGNTLTVAMSSIIIEVAGGNILSYSNNDSELIISGLTFDNQTSQINTILATVTGLVSSATDQEIVMNAFIALNNVSAIPTNTNQNRLFLNLLRLVRGTTRLEISSITLIEINASAVSVSGDGTSIIIAQGGISISTTGTLVEIYGNADAETRINGLSTQNGIIDASTSVLSIPFVEQISDSEISRNAFIGLDGVTVIVPTNPNQLVAYNFLLAHLRNNSNLRSGINITSITIQNPAVNVTASATGQSISIAQGALSININGAFFPTANTGNDAGPVIITGVQIDAGNIINISNATLIGLNPQPTQQESAVNVLRSVSDFIPANGGNIDQVSLANALLRAVQTVAPLVTTIDLITLENFNITASNNGNTLTIAAGTLILSTTGVNVNLFGNNTGEIQINGITFGNTGPNFDNSLITGIVALPSSSLIFNETQNVFTNLNGITAIPTTANELAFFNLFNQIVELDSFPFTFTTINSSANFILQNLGNTLIITGTFIFTVTVNGSTTQVNYGIDSTSPSQTIIINNLTFSANLFDLSGASITGFNQLIP